jgi:flavin reductase (DIM6/NTAB) family NADH-FMN oxidoreductase RutF
MNQVSYKDAVVLTRAATTNASSMSILRRSARFVISLVSTANAEVIRRIQVTTLTIGPRLSFDLECCGIVWCDGEDRGSAVIASLVQVNHFKRFEKNVRSVGGQQELTGVRK